MNKQLLQALFQTGVKVALDLIAGGPVTPKRFADALKTVLQKTSRL